MKKNFFKRCACVSTVLFLGFVVLYAFVLVSGSISSAGSHAYWSGFPMGKFHVGITPRWGGGLLFFNQKVPYMGSIVSFSGEKHVVEHTATGFGIYFRFIDYVDGKETWWTLMVSLWYPIIIFGILPAVYVVQKLRGTKPVTKSEGAKT